MTSFLLVAIQCGRGGASSSDLLRIVQCDDRGPSTHMMEILTWEPEYHTYIWQIDDDQKYGVDVLKTMM